MIEGMTKDVTVVAKMMKEEVTVVKEEMTGVMKGRKCHVDVSVPKVVAKGRDYHQNT